MEHKCQRCGSLDKISKIPETKEEKEIILCEDCWKLVYLALKDKYGQDN